jgi:hypothetical protein
MIREERTCSESVFDISCVEPEGHEGPHRIPASAMFTRPGNPEPITNPGSVGKK